MAAGIVLSRPERDLSLARAWPRKSYAGSVLIDPADGADCKTTTVRFATHLKQAEGTPRRDERILVSETSPNLMLNTWHGYPGTKPDTSNAMNEGCGPPGSSRMPPRSSTNAHSSAIRRTTAATPTGMFASDAIFSVN